MLLLPTALLWTAVVLQDAFGLERFVGLVFEGVSDLAFVALALLLPFATIFFGVWAWHEMGATGGLIASLTATVFLGFALVAAAWPEFINRRSRLRKG